MMDLYITDSLQDMLDIDIKSEMATDLGSTNDFADTFGVNFNDLPPLDIEMDNAMTWITGSNSNSHNSSNFVHNLDLYGSEANAVMVNPNSVMPSMFSESPCKKSDDDSNHILNSSVSCDSSSRSSTPEPLDEKNDSAHSFDDTDYPIMSMSVKLEDQDEDSVDSFNDNACLPNPKIFVVKKENMKNGIKEEDLTDDLQDDNIGITTNIIPNLRIKSSQPEIVKINGKNCSILSTNQNITSAQFIKSSPNGTQTIISGNIHILGHQQSKALLSGSNKNSATILIDNGTLNNNRQLLKSSAITSSTFNDNGSTKIVSSNKMQCCSEFPKPAYSYSCLIAMALKNSRTGSLPVAEIYNFMCQHFPYFKTAPNGWKNSVRHNLSLNKCFEKIEKPATNGGQRKGCLWAMNPSKVGKMDEEVQKWSRKDPQAIRKAMVRPDNLEALERGEMKFCSENNGEDYGSEEEELDVDETYLVASPTVCSPTLVHQYDDETSDVEVMENTYDEVEVDEKPLLLEFSVASSQIHTESPAKRPKSNFMYQQVSTTPHVSRRKAPLVNRIG